MSKKEEESFKEDNKDIEEVDSNSEESSKKETEKSNDEPSWYHYLVVLGVVLIVIVGVPMALYNLTDFGDERDIDGGDENEIDRDTFIYEYERGGATYNIEFDSRIEEFTELDAEIEIDRYDILNTINVKFGIDTYEDQDERYVATVSTKLMTFLSKVYYFNFEEGDIQPYNNLNCTHSTPEERVFVFDPYSDRTGVFEKENGCVSLEAQNPQDFRKLGDLFIYSLTDAEE